MFNLHKAFKEISILWLGSIGAALFAFLTQVILARMLGPADFGLFSSAFTTVALLVPLAGFGVAQFWLKAFGKEGYAATNWLMASFRFISISTLISIVVMCMWAIFGPNDEKNKTILIIFSTVILGQVSIELISAKFQLEEKYRMMAMFQLAPHFFRFVLIGFIFFFLLDLSNLFVVSLIYSVISIITFIFGLMILRQTIRNGFVLVGHHKAQETSSEQNYSEQNKSVLSVFLNSWPFGLAAFFHLIYYQSDIIFLKYLVNDEAAGIYNVAFTIIAAVYLLPAVIYQKYLLPKFHRWSNRDQEKFFQAYKLGFKLMTLLGVGSMLAIWLMAFWAVPLLFGVEFTRSVLILNILALSVPLIFIAFNSGATLVTQDNMKRKVKYMGGVAILNVVLNLLLIPYYQEVGAAIATIASNLILAVFYYHGTRKYVFGSYSNNIL